MFLVHSLFLSFFLSATGQPFDRSKHRTQVSSTWLNYLAKYRCLQSCTCRCAARILPDNIDRLGPGTAGEQEFLILSSCRNSARPPPPRLDPAHVSSPPGGERVVYQPRGFHRERNPVGRRPVHLSMRNNGHRCLRCPRARQQSRGKVQRPEPDFSWLANLRHRFVAPRRRHPVRTWTHRVRSGGANAERRILRRFDIKHNRQREREREREACVQMGGPYGARWGETHQAK